GQGNESGSTWSGRDDGRRGPGGMGRIEGPQRASRRQEDAGEGRRCAEAAAAAAGQECRQPQGERSSGYGTVHVDLVRVAKARWRRARRRHRGREVALEAGPRGRLERGPGQRVLEEILL